MANEIQATAVLRCRNGAQGIDQLMQVLDAQFTMTGDSATRFIQSVGTSEEALSLGQDIGTPGWCLIKNLDATNYVSVRRASGEGNFLKLKAGEFALFRLEASAPYVIANTAAVRIEVLLLED